MLQACLNGAKAKDFNAAVPCTPQELSRDAKAVIGAGADELHIHPRDDLGKESLRASDIANAIEAVRASVPGIPVGVSTGWWIAPGGRERLQYIRAWRVLPDYVSVNLREEDAPDVIACALAMGMGVEAGLSSRQDAERFVALPDAPRCLRVLIEIEEQDIKDAHRAAHDVIAALDRSSLRLPRLLHGLDEMKWPLYQESLRLRLDARIGFEDGGTLPSGQKAKSNAELIGAARALRAAR